jgi:hypothetical protein
MIYLITDQKGSMVTDFAGQTCDRFNIKQIFAGMDPNKTGSLSQTTTGLIENHIRLTKATALKIEGRCQKTGHIH